MRHSRFVIVCVVGATAVALFASGCSLWRTAPSQTSTTQTAPTETQPPAGTTPVTETAPPETSSPKAKTGEPSAAEPTKSAPVVPGTLLASLKASAKTAALSYAKKNTAIEGALTAGEIRLARTSHGVWWASVVVKPPNPGDDAATAYLKRVGDKWVVVDFGTGITPAEEPDLFPKDIAGQL